VVHSLVFFFFLTAEVADAEFFYFRQDLRDYHDFILYHHFPPARNALACEAGGDESDEA
jgi:hypothetical protein